MVGALAACSSSHPVVGGAPRIEPGEPSSPARARMTPRSGLEVIGAMRRMYPSRELKSLTFTLTATDTNGADRSSLVSARLPGRFRETMLPTRQRTGSVRDRQRLALFERGKRVELVRRTDLAALLAYDLFAQSIDSTIAQLDSSRMRFGIVREDSFDDRPVWVVGALAGDTTSSQFWVDAERWIVLRVIQRDPRSPTRTTDVRFTQFEDHLNIPVPVRADVYRGGRLVEQRTVSNIAVNPSISTRAFDLSRWRDVR